MIMGNINNELTVRLQQNDIEAFNELYWKYHAALYTNVLKLTRDPLVAEDILQEVFTCLWEKRHALDAGQDISGWLFVVSYNKSLTHLKRKLKEATIAPLHIEQQQPAVDPEDDPLNSRESLLGKAIEQLSPQRRKVFELCKVQRRTYEEAALELNLSKHTVKEYLSGAVVSIKEFIRQHPGHLSICLAMLYANIHVL